MKRPNKQPLRTLFWLIGVNALYVGFRALTSQFKLPLAMLIAPSVLLGFSVFFLLRLFQCVTSSKTDKLLPITVSVYVVLLSLLASLQQLGAKDAILAGLLLWLFVFYYKRARNK